MPLIVSVSGVRGVVGESLTPEVVSQFAAAYGSTRSGGRIVLSRDGRPSGELFAHAAIAGLMAVGCEVVDIGIAATPTCGFYVRWSAAAGGIQITASHNPPQYNGLKLFRPEGFVVGPAEGDRIARAFRAGARNLVTIDRLGFVRAVADAHRAHVERVVSLVDVDKIVKRSFRVVYDAGHGAGAVLGPPLLERLGCQVTLLGGVADGKFEHGPEPTEANLAGLCDAVNEAGAELGFAVDPDADRLAIVDGRGRYLGEEYSLALAIRHRTRQQKGPVVLNGSTSRLSESTARSAGCPVFRTPVGEVYVAERMLAEGAVIGGEGNGGVIDPRVGLGRDSAAGIALVLDLLAQTTRPLAELVDEMPVYAIRKEKFTLPRDRLEPLLEALAKRFADAEIDQSDGLRLEWPAGWLQVRASNTEPIVRVIAESTDPDQAAEWTQVVRELIG